jgi:hypothetical protein
VAVSGERTYSVQVQPSGAGAVSSPPHDQPSTDALLSVHVHPSLDASARATPGAARATTRAAVPKRILNDLVTDAFRGFRGRSVRLVDCLETRIVPSLAP